MSGAELSREVCAKCKGDWTDRDDRLWEEERQVSCPSGMRVSLLRLSRCPRHDVPHWCSYLTEHVVCSDAKNSGLRPI